MPLNYYILEICYNNENQPIIWAGFLEKQKELLTEKKPWDKKKEKKTALHLSSPET